MRSVEPLIIMLSLIWEDHTPPVWPTSVRRHWEEKKKKKKRLVQLLVVETLEEVAFKDIRGDSHFYLSLFS